MKFYWNQRNFDIWMKNIFWNSYNKYIIGFKRTCIPALKPKCVCAPFHNKQTYTFFFHFSEAATKRCSEICSRNPSKIHVKKFVFSKVADLKLCNFTKNELLHWYLSKILTACKFHLVTFRTAIFKNISFS